MQALIEPEHSCESAVQIAYTAIMQVGTLSGEFSIIKNDAERLRRIEEIASAADQTDLLYQVDC